MSPEDVKVKLIEVLQEIQSDSGYEETPISGITCPMTDLKGFDSLLGVEAINMLADKLDVEIPSSHVHKICLSQDGKRWLTIDESVAVVCEIVNRGET
jgi:acyl carrier protein